MPDTVNQKTTNINRKERRKKTSNIKTSEENSETTYRIQKMFLKNKCKLF